jgi:hypothetical protein
MNSMALKAFSGRVNYIGYGIGVEMVVLLGTKAAWRKWMRGKNISSYVWYGHYLVV